MLDLICPAIRAVDSVVDIQADLGYAFDDTKQQPAPEHDELPITHSPLASRRLT